jgi:uncharacterized membrane protein YkvA (DUF1232 family)
MSELKITFTLSSQDVAHLRRLIRGSTTAAAREEESSIVSAAETLAKEVRTAQPPDYVLERVEKLESMVHMVQDEEYGIPVKIKKKVLGGLAYLAHPADLIPDSIPGLGFLDDAIMIELIAQDLRHELVGYKKFRDFRQSAEQRPWTRVGRESLKAKLVEKRKQIREEIHKKQARDAERAKSGGGGGFLKGLW